MFNVFINTWWLELRVSYNQPTLAVTNTCILLYNLFSPLALKSCEANVFP